METSSKVQADFKLSIKHTSSRFFESIELKAIESEPKILSLVQELSEIFKFAFPGKFLQTNRNVRDLLL